MPLDSTIPQETRVVARQTGGRLIPADSALWRTLFPSELLRIDGRVPVDKSSQFLLQNEFYQRTNRCHVLAWFRV
jgi:hypothetical protein